MKRLRITAKMLFDDANKKANRQIEVNEGEEKDQKWESERRPKSRCKETELVCQHFNIDLHENFQVYGEAADTEEFGNQLDRTRFWSLLSSQDILRVYFLLTTTYSKAAVNRYFDVELLENEHLMKTLIFQRDHIFQVTICAVCAEEENQCACGEVKSLSTVVFSDWKKLLNTLLTLYGYSILETQADVIRGRSTTSPMNHGTLKETLMGHIKAGELSIHFMTGFDGIKLHSRGRLKCWPFTMIPLDLEDRERSSLRSVLTCALYFGSKDPSSKVHDRIVEWVVSEMATSVVWNELLVKCWIASGARRKVYGLRSHSSRGSCPYCLNQDTVCKINDRFTISRSDVKEDVPEDLEDGLINSYTSFHELIPMYWSPIDIFHVFQEGIFEKILSELSGSPKLRIFENCMIDMSLPISLPSNFRQLSGRLKDITGSERATIFQTIVLLEVYIGNFPAVPSAIIFTVYVLFRLNCDPGFITDPSLCQKVSKSSDLLAYLIETYAPNMIRGSKVHQVLYHLADSVKRYGPLLPLSTQAHEHSYHALKRHLCPEITNGLGLSLMRNSISIQELHSEVVKRLDGNVEEYCNDIHGQKMMKILNISRKPGLAKSYEIPQEFARFQTNNDQYYKSHYFNGIRYSSIKNGLSDDRIVMYNSNGKTKYGIVQGFLINSEDEERCRVIIQQFQLSDIHIQSLASKMFAFGIPRHTCQELIDICCSSKFGAVVVGKKNPTTFPLSCLIGHAVFIERDSRQIVIPFSHRVMLS
ncbi:hypothetical protein GCK72_010948 [Caenorhabditis remanei]|uniref:Uncharacterized protein n=1 Tax=Caenorhabditis remanei TaxID=31234 RepID=A0A6A5H746_CAERE|nr:hypothetical protein GCK72_010948 [Caenorhabditis remanei]KAF1762686.1 hypothetical protein GCK72_010948 [Caenorhabditis remanei]